MPGELGDSSRLLMGDNGIPGADMNGSGECDSGGSPAGDGISVERFSGDGGDILPGEEPVLPTVDPRRLRS